MNVDIMICIFIFVSYFLGVITSVCLLSALLKKLDKKYTYINTIFEQYLESASDAGDN